MFWLLIVSEISFAFDLTIQNIDSLISFLTINANVSVCSEAGSVFESCACLIASYVRIHIVMLSSLTYCNLHFFSQLEN